MKVDWTPLREEFALWRQRALVLPFWWRDDDAVSPTAALDRLAALSDEVAVPVHLAIIPKHATEDLAQTLAPPFIPVVHGWSHENQAPAGKKKSEFNGRPTDQAVADFKQAKARMDALFGARLAPMFVPPWNRIDPELYAHLPALGYDAVSTYNPRVAPEAAPGVAQINTHIDPIMWRGTRGLVAPERLVRQICGLLRKRRRGKTDNAEPLGYMTHHLVHDADIWAFTRQLLMEFREGPVQLYRHDKRGF